HADRLALRLGAGEPDNDLANRDTGHPLRRIDGDADRFLRGVHVDYGARADAARDLVPDADDTHRRMSVRELALLDLGDEARDLARAHIQRGDRARPPRRNGPPLKAPRTQRNHIHVLPPRTAAAGRPTPDSIFASVAIPF